MHQNRLVLLYSVFNEVKNCFSGRVFRIKNYLVLKVQPLEGKIHYTSALEVVLNLLACTIDDVSYLVSHHELLVLQKCQNIIKLT